MDLFPSSFDFSWGGGGGGGAFILFFDMTKIVLRKEPSQIPLNVVSLLFPNGTEAGEFIQPEMNFSRSSN